jgi:hypothetical protein
MSLSSLNIQSVGDKDLHLARLNHIVPSRTNNPTMSSLNPDIPLLLDRTTYPSFVQLNYAVDEAMKEMEKILDNPWGPDQTFDLFRLLIDTIDFFRLFLFSKALEVFENKKEPLQMSKKNSGIQSYSGAVILAISTLNLYCKHDLL